MKDVALILSETTVEDLHTLFEFQRDEESIYLAAFTPSDPNDKIAYLEKYSKFLNDPTKTTRTIRVGDEIVGSVAKFVMDGDAEITYWIDRKFWGRGIATTALRRLLEIETVRPIYGRVAFDNYGSQKVLEKCGFVKVREDKGFANARRTEIKEFIYKLSD